MMGKKGLLAGLLIGIFLLGGVALIGCSEENEDTVGSGMKKGTIERAALSDDENRLLTAVGVNHVEVFDVKITDETGEFLKFWVDYYEEGEHIGRFADTWFHMHSDDKKGQLVISSSQEKDEWIFAMIQAEEGSVSTFPETFPAIDYGMGNTLAAIDSVDLEENSEPIIMVQAYSSSEESVFSGQVFEEDPEAMEKLIHNEHVYIVRVAVTDSTD